MVDDPEAGMASTKPRLPGSYRTHDPGRRVSAPEQARGRQSASEEVMARGRRQPDQYRLDS